MGTQINRTAGVVVPFPVLGAYVRLPIVATEAKIIPFPRPMRTDLPQDAVTQMVALRRERQMLELVSDLFPASNLGE